MTSDAMVSLDGFSFRYEGASGNAVADVDLRVRRGECVVLTGRSGCGKTTLMRAMNGLIPLVYRGESKGSVAIEGKPLGEWTSDALVAKVGSVFQNPRGQFVNDEVAAELAFGCENQGLSRDAIADRVRESAYDLGISHLLGCCVDELSGGQCQMVILASVHATHPDVYVLDEPTAALDVESMQRLGRAISHLKAQGKTIIVSEHRLWWIADAADRVVVIEGGRIADDLPAEEFAAVPYSTRVRRGLHSWTVAEIDAAARTRLALDAAKGGPDDAPALRVAGLTVGYRTARDVVHGFDLNVPPGEVVGVIGPNGAGKTTLARCLCGLQRESSGAVELLGRRLKFSRRAGAVYLVMQNPGYQLFENSVRGELAEALARGISETSGTPSAVDEMMRNLDLFDLAERHPLSLSGGQRQRVSIAAGMLYGARAMVMDEPTSGLDYQSMAGIVRQIGRLKERGMGICVITHDYEFLCAACDEVVYVDAGRASPSIPLAGTTLDQVKSLLGFMNATETLPEERNAI